MCRVGTFGLRILASDRANPCFTASFLPSRAHNAGERVTALGGISSPCSAAHGPNNPVQHTKNRDQVNAKHLRRRKTPDAGVGGRGKASQNDSTARLIANVRTHGENWRNRFGDGSSADFSWLHHEKRKRTKPAQQGRRSLEGY